MFRGHEPEKCCNHSFLRVAFLFLRKILLFLNIAFGCHEAEKKIREKNHLFSLLHGVHCSCKCPCYDIEKKANIRFVCTSPATCVL